VLRERFQLSAETLRPKDDWLVTQLFELIDQLQVRLARGERPVPEERSRLADLLALRTELGLGTGQELETPLPWAYHMQHILCGNWEAVDDGTLRCPHCGGSQVRRKSRTPRAKRYIDAQGQQQTVDVFRYYCQNTACPRGSFTNLPPDLLPYSPWRTEVHLQALHAYELGCGSYRRVAAGLGVSTATAYRWVSQFGGQLLPVAALFGVVRSSGVVGVDEKWVKVPTNDKLSRPVYFWLLATFGDSSQERASSVKSSHSGSASQSHMLQNVLAAFTKSGQEAIVHRPLHIPTTCCTWRSTRCAARPRREPSCWRCGPRAMCRRCS
jgi:hypothetical protein